MQQQLFATDPIEMPKPQPGLVIAKGSKQNLSKNQQAFNRITQKIERLHKDIESKQLEFDTALKMYGAQVHPLQQQIAGCERQLVTIFWDVYKSKKLSKADQRHLKDILENKAQELYNAAEGEPDEELKKIIAELEGISVEKLMERQKEMLKAEMEEMLDDFDFDIDGMDMNDEKSMFEKYAQAEQQMREQQEQQEQHQQERFEQRKKKKRLTPKQEEAERLRKAVDEMKQKNISTIYRQLAKLFHPDLEQDEERRVEKEILMKELTAAYEAKNLHMLLSLELKWIHKENDHLESLGDDKLNIYLQILKEQARDLEHEIINMFQQPRYGLLLQAFGFKVQRFPLEQVKGELRQLKKLDADFKKDIENFQSPHCIRYIKSLISQWKALQRGHKQSREDELMEAIFRQSIFKR